MGFLAVHQTLAPDDDFEANKCCPLSFNFSFCLSYGFLTPLLVKSRCVFPSFKRHLADIAKAIEKYRCSCLVASPKTYFDLMQFLDVHYYDVSSIRFLESGAQIVSKNLVEKAREKFNFKYFTIMYGMTELLDVTIFLIDNDRIQKKRERFPVGKPKPFIELKVVDLNDPII